MIWTADRPDAAARDCSQARWRHDGEHHFGRRPVALTAIGPPHHPHVDAASLPTREADSTWGAEPDFGPPEGDTFGCGAGWALGARTRGEARRGAFRRLLMPAMIRMNVSADVTPMRHDGTIVLDAPGV
jgi:hypothetical protein